MTESLIPPVPDKPDAAMVSPITVQEVVEYFRHHGVASLYGPPLPVDAKHSPVRMAFYATEVGDRIKALTKALGNHPDEAVPTVTDLHALVELLRVALHHFPDLEAELCSRMHTLTREAHVTTPEDEEPSGATALEVAMRADDACDEVKAAAGALEIALAGLRDALAPVATGGAR